MPDAHRAGADDADGRGDRDPDEPTVLTALTPACGTSALMPVAARPMISFWICDVPS